MAVKKIFLWWLLSIPIVLIGQSNPDFFLIKDAATRLPIDHAKVEFSGHKEIIFSSIDGSCNFNFVGEAYSLLFEGQAMLINHISDVSIDIYDAAGRLFYNKHIAANAGAQSKEYIPTLANGYYLLKVAIDGSSYTHVLISPVMNAINGKSNLGSSVVTISKEGYYSKSIAWFDFLKLIQDKKEISLLKQSYSESVSHLYELPNASAYDLLKGKPFNQTLTDVASVKLLFDIHDKTVVYFNSDLYLTHFDFASSQLDYKLSKQLFNTIEYRYNDQRRYIPATLNYYKNINQYVLEFSSFCEVSCEHVKAIYKHILATSFLSNTTLAVLKSNQYLDDCDVVTISAESLYGSQNYQPLNLAESYGFLKKVSIDSIEDTYLSWQDIVLVDGIPADLSVVAGLITTPFQTPLSHVNVLSHNRHTPNMALKNAFAHPHVLALVDKLVYINVRLDSFELRAATKEEAEAFWKTRLPQTNLKLPYDSITTGLVELKEKGHFDVALIGGKASNFAELMKIKLADGTAIPLPEHAFAIPFQYYIKHMKDHGLDGYVNHMLSDSAFYKDPNAKKKYLADLQHLIKQADLDADLLNMVKMHIGAEDPSSSYRFRSSTNAEDIEGFNGAGLYDSYTGHLTLKDKEIDKAIKKTWASLWNLRAFDERAFFGIDQHSVAMAVLVHRSFPDEYANGVVVTHNPFNQYNDAILINVQVGENSVVRPDDYYLPDQILYYNYMISQEAYEYISHTTLPGYEGKTIMTPAELKALQQYCLAIEQHYCEINPPCKTMDIEFKIDIVDGKHKMYIKQARYY